MKFSVVTASLDPEKTEQYWGSWKEKAKEQFKLFHVVGEMGVVPAFAKGVIAACADGAEIIACFHDDLRIDEEGWDLKVKHWFELQKKCGLAGFFGAKSLGAGDIYQTPYSPMQLARGNCGSNMVGAEDHGERWLSPRQVICFDGYSQIGRAPLMKAWWGEIAESGIKHHFYDGMLGALCARDKWEAWYLPVACMHAGGVTAVGSVKYQEWAKTQYKDGDKGIWEEAHRIGYEHLRGVLPLWID